MAQPIAGGPGRIQKWALFSALFRTAEGESAEKCARDTSTSGEQQGEPATSDQDLAITLAPPSLQQDLSDESIVGAVRVLPSEETAPQGMPGPAVAGSSHGTRAHKGRARSKRAKGAERPGAADATPVAETATRSAAPKAAPESTMPLGICIRVCEEALRKARSHAASSLDQEVGGLCIGAARRSGPNSLWTVEITDTFVAEHTLNHRASITFTPDTWSAAHRVVEQNYAGQGLGLVGWYHTHPGFGVFLSAGYDLFIHENFFNQPWHVALVIDPLRQQEGFFVWDGTPPAILPYPAGQVTYFQANGSDTEAALEPGSS
jgi:proteasome lid subunit RPN8/RPN11